MAPQRSNEVFARRRSPWLGREGGKVAAGILVIALVVFGQDLVGAVTASRRLDPALANATTSPSNVVAVLNFTLERFHNERLAHLRRLRRPRRRGQPGPAPPGDAFQPAPTRAPRLGVANRAAAAASPGGASNPGFLKMTSPRVSASLSPSLRAQRSNPEPTRKELDCVGAGAPSKVGERFLVLSPSLRAKRSNPAPQARLDASSQGAPRNAGERFSVVLSRHCERSGPSRPASKAGLLRRKGSSQ